MKHYFEDKAPQLSMVETTDVDQQAHNLTHWQQIYDQTSHGQFYGCIKGLAYSDTHVFKEFTQRGLRQQCQISPNSVWIGIPVDSTESKINGLQVEKQHIMCRTSECDFELITPENFNIYGVVINRKTLVNMADILGITLAPFFIDGEARLAVNPSLLSHCNITISQILAHCDMGLHCQIQQDIILTSIVNLLAKQDKKTSTAPSYQHRLTVVNKVKSYIEAHPHQAITITQLCECSHVSRRTLQYSFESILGINPLRFLRLTRLNNVRRELKQTEQDSTIANIAAKWGFWHPGQFTKDYTQLFGENPSHTLKRNQNELK